MCQKKIVKNDPENQYSPYIPSYIKSLVLPIILALTCFYLGGIYRLNNLRFQYISQDQILALEKKRISTQNIRDRQLFYGKPEEAIKHIEQIQKNMSKNGVIIFLADSKIYSSNISSISQEVHLKIIEILKEQ